MKPDLAPDDLALRGSSRPGPASKAFLTSQARLVANAPLVPLWLYLLALALVCVAYGGAA